MRTLAYFLSALVAGPLAVGPALACGYRTVYRSPVSYYPPVVVEKVVPVVVAEFVPILVPTYSVTYAPPVAAVTTPAASVPAQGAAPAASNTQALLDRITALEKELEACKRQLKGGPAPKESAPERVDAGPPVKLFVQKCAQCHDQKTAEAYGDGVVLVQDGKLAPMGAKRLLRIGTKTYSGKMPKKGVKDKDGKEIHVDPLTDEEVGQIQAWLDGGK